MQKAKEKKKIVSKNRLNSAVLILCLVALVILTTIALIQWSLLRNPFQYQKKEIESVSVIDACGIIVGQLIHTVPDEDICKSKCLVACEVREKSFVRINFTENKGDCNDCGCFCE